MILSMDNGVHTESDTTRALLDTVGSGWHLVRGTRPTSGDRDLDLLLVGPPGVVALTMRTRPGATAWVGARSVTVDGHHTVFLQNARSHAERSALLLAQASGRAIPVIPAVVLASLAGFNVQQMPSDVHVTTDRRLRGWLASLPVRLEADEIDVIATGSSRVSR